MFKFIPDHVGGVGTKRKQVQKSCDACRKRHKRCGHGETSVSPRASDDATEGSERLGDASRGSHNLLREPVTATAAGDDTRAPSLPSPPTRLASKDTYLRFVGDLSPEASFLSNKRRGVENAGASRHAEVGVWLGQRSESNMIPAGQREITTSSHHNGPRATPLRSSLPSLRALSSQLREDCISMLPAPYEFGILMNLYRSKVDPIFPILEGEDLDLHATMDALVLKQCICLIAALDPKLRKHLRLPHTERILSPIEFRTCISDAIKQALDMGFVCDGMVLLQACALMAFYADQANCSEVSAHYVSQAVHHAQTLGLHLGWPDDGAKTEKSRRIFWCIWILDRLNAAANGRPILMHRQDMESEIMSTFSEQSPAFKLHIRIAQFLDRVISRYRPQSALVEELSLDDDVTFEDMVSEAGAVDVASPILASLEMFYLAVIILRHRPQQTEVRGQPVPSSDLQLFAATSIVAIASEDFKSSITLWPVAPYAVSLATSVAYKSLRNSVMTYRRKRAYALFHNSCEVLDEMGKAFCSARTVAKLATDTMQEVERVAAGRSKARQLHKLPNMGQRAQQHDETHNGHDVTPTVSMVSSQDQRLLDNTISGIHGLVSVSAQPATGQQSMIPNESPSIFDDFIGDAGIFNDFDPNFDLDRIDQVFSANLDPTQPLPSQGWATDFHFG